MEYGLIGRKLGHSFSKTVHNLIGDYDYELKEIEPENLEEFMLKKYFKAINVTIPYKQDVIPFLEEIDPFAQKIGAVNTIVNKNGKLFGYNTDFLGLKSLILKNNMDLKGKKVLILGSGGTSKTAIAVAEDLSASEIYCLSRKGSEGLITYEEAYRNHTDAEVIINTTPCGMYPKIGESAIDIEKFPRLEAVVDAVYNPLSSALVVGARNKGINAIGGLYMLISQGVFASELFLNKKYPETLVDGIFEKIVKEKENIVLIGMPASGKTTVGKALAESLGKSFYDSDEEIVKKEGISIPEIFALKGEKYFRECESEVIKELSALQGAVIATGGGAVLNPKNTDLLKENGKVFFLDRNLDDMVATPDRPLSSTREDLEKRYKERYPIYCSSADYKINCSNDVAENVNAIKEVLKSENFSY